MLIAKNIFLGFLAFLLLGAVYLIQAGIAVVDVKTPEARIWIPVPVALGHWAGDLADWKLERQPQWNQVMKYRETAARLLQQLKDQPDADFVEVRNAKEQVRIYKENDALHVSVISDKEKVRLRIPLRIVDKAIAVLDSPRPGLGDLVSCLEWQPAGDLVEVENDKEHIRISLL